MSATLYTLITGASSGIGRAAAIRLSRERSLILHGRDGVRLEETRNMCESAEKHVTWRFDLKAVDDLADCFMALLADGGRAVESFVHCAGTVTVLPVRSIDHRVAREAMAVNFFSAIEIINVLLKQKVNDHALTSVVFISTIWSRFGARGHSAYCASKAALDGFMRAMAVELAPAIRVNSILPGAILTSMAEQGIADPTIWEKLERDYPMGIGQPDDIADTIEFVLSKKARWLTGQQIAIDGGRTVNMSLK